MVYLTISCNIDVYELLDSIKVDVVFNLSKPTLVTGAFVHHVRHQYW